MLSTAPWLPTSPLLYGSSPTRCTMHPTHSVLPPWMLPIFARRLPRGSVAATIAAAAAKGKDVRAVPDAVVARLQQFSGESLPSLA
jgi:hypothetical protein